MQTLPVIPVAARAASNGNPGIVPPWLADRGKNPGIVPPWLQHPIVLPVEPEVVRPAAATTTGFDPQPIDVDEDTPRIWGA